MRAGTILRTVGIIIFLAGLILGIVMVAGAQSLITTYTANTNLTSVIMWGVAIYIWISSVILACLIFTVGTMSNNMDEINIKMEDMQSNTLETTKTLRYIMNIIDKRLFKGTIGIDTSRAEKSTQYIPRSNIRSNSTDI